MKATVVRKKLLILTSATGAGHDTHARAASEWCRELYGDDVEVRVEHLLEDSHWFYLAGVSFYNWIQCRAPWFHHIYYHVVEFLDLLNFGKVTLGKQYYIDLLKSYRPDAILSVHDCLNRGYFELAKEVLDNQVRCGTYCPEFLTGYGFSRNWINPRGDFFFARTREVAESKPLQLPDSIQVTEAGHWAPHAFYGNPLSDDEKRAYLVSQFDLEPGRFTLLLSTGGSGAQNHRCMLQALDPLSAFIQVIALCGRGDEVRLELGKWCRQHLEFPVAVSGFRDDMPRLLQSCSAVVARAGATTAGEALLCSCPVIFNALGGIMPQEIPTWRYFKKHGIGSIAHSPGNVTARIKPWIMEPEVYGELRQKMAALRNGKTPEASLRSLLD